MRKKFAMTRASLQETASPTAGPLVILANTGAVSGYDHKTVLSSYKCTACGTHMSVNAGIEPFCLNCGSEQVDAVDEVAAVLPETDASLCENACVACSASNVFPIAYAKALAGMMHCASCGEELSFKMDSDEPVLLDHADAGEIDDALPNEMADVELLDHADADEIDDALPNEMADVAIDLTEILDDEEIPENPEGQDQASVSVATTLGMTLKGKSVNLASLGDNVVAFVDGTHVATLTPEHAGVMAGEMHEQVFQDAVQHEAKASGVLAALKHFGFKRAAVKVQTDKVVAGLVKTKTEAVIAKASKSQDELSDAFLQSMSIAAAGLNKGFFKSHANPVKNSLIASLTAAGVQGATRVVASAFSSSADAYNRTLITKARELMEMSNETRNEIAGAISGASFEQANNEDESDTQTETAASVLPFRKAEVATATHTTRKSNTHTGAIAGVRAKAGGSLFA